MGKLTSADLKMTDEKLKAYEGEVRGNPLPIHIFHIYR